MTTRSAFVGLLACPEGRHRAFTHWHDQDHRPENVGQIDHVFHSERWVASPALVEAQEADATGLVPEKVHYVHTYWSTQDPDILLHDMTVVRERLRLQGRCEPIGRDFRAHWRDRLHPVTVLSSDPHLSEDALPVAPNAGLVVSLIEVSTADHGLARLLHDEALPMVVGLDSVRGAVILMPRLEQDHHLQVHLYFTRHDQVREAQAAIQQVEHQMGGDLVRVHHRGAYEPSRPHEPTPYE